MCLFLSSCNKKNIMNVVLLLAGGVGKRAGADIPKQFVRVNDIPIIVYTLKKFQESQYVDAICVVVHENWKDELKKYIDDYGISKLKWIVDGGRTGLESVQNGVNYLKDLSDEDILMIHDSVRPFITQKAIEDNINLAKQHGCAVTSVPCVETLVKVDSEGMSTTQISRDGLMRVMTPQSFKLKLLRKLFFNEDVLNSPYPSTFALYMSKGFPVYCSFGSERNIKITYPEDIDYLKKLFEI